MSRNLKEEGDCRRSRERPVGITQQSIGSPRERERRKESVQRGEKNPMDLTGVLFGRDQKGKDDAQSGGISMAESIHVGIIVPELSDM